MKKKNYFLVALCGCICLFGMSSCCTMMDILYGPPLPPPHHHHHHHHVPPPPPRYYYFGSTDIKTGAEYDMAATEVINQGVDNENSSTL